MSQDLVSQQANGAVFAAIFFRIFPEEGKVQEIGPRLRLTNITAERNGVYSCRAENTAGTIESSENCIINVKAPGYPYLQEDKFTPYQLALKYQAARLDCPFQDGTRVDWFSEHAKLQNPSSRYTIYPNGSLYFPEVQGSDEGTYRCESYGVQSSKSQSFTAELILSDLKPITPQSFEPRLRPDFPIVIPANQNFEIKVFPPSGRPRPDYRWLDSKGRLVGTSGNVRVEDDTTLVFEKAQEDDAGNFTFVANNTWGEKRKRVWIVVSITLVTIASRSNLGNHDKAAVTLVTMTSRSNLGNHDKPQQP
ncbi:tyrosine-protein kinase-like 7 [Elysia marginata]|uniref:Tyrosine-protein kinase-like 7 n=1 Tax=Elysia marginata TaxID=1093978 RepID=A0AAV4JTI6_9GAST|nr:tyrosine-protein kinase-like 7 [Elysia marginata]